MEKTISIATLLRGKPQIAINILGDTEVDDVQINSFEDYSDIYKIRHDLIHAAVCDALNIPFGERRVDEILLENKIECDKELYYNEVRKQTPDYFGITAGKMAKVIEITVSSDPNAKNRKQSKYALLLFFLKKIGLTVDYLVLVFHPKNIYINRTEMLQVGISDLTLDFAKKVCNNTSQLLASVHLSDKGKLWWKQFHESSITECKMEFDSNDVIQTNEILGNKCFHSTKDLQNLLEEDISDNDDRFLNYCSEKVLSVDSLLTTIEHFDDKRFIESLVEASNTRDLRSVFPLPFLKMKTVDSALRKTMSDLDLLVVITSKMQQSSSSVISTLGKYCSEHVATLSEDHKNEDLLFDCKFNEFEKSEIAMDGPGRKKFIKKGSMRHKEKSKEYDGYALDPRENVDQIESCSFQLSQKNLESTTGLIDVDMDKLSNIEGLGLTYVRICQSIFREININSMRGDRRRKFIIKPTGVDGVYVCLFKGTKLRCGELANAIWFKLIVDNDLLLDDGFLYSWIFKKLIRDYKVSYTSWLSVDVHRLDHYIRCFDKILMAYCSMMTNEYKTKRDLEDPKSDVSTEDTLINMINKDNTNTLGLIIMTYMEDKRSTSKMLQNIRYLVMTSISIWPKYDSVMNKFKDAIRSPLQLYYLKKCLAYIDVMKKWDITSHMKFGNVRYDRTTHSFLDMHGGSNIRFPRPLITSELGYAEFSQILGEMYFTMLFNKNQDDPTHSSFQVLDKIIEGEDNFQSVKEKGDHLGYRADMTDEDFANKILTEKKTHMFSKKAIEIGSKLLRLQNDDPTNLQIIESASKTNLNKTLDEFATYKSSSVFENETFNAMRVKQNPRRKCMEGVMELCSKGFFKSFDVVKEFKSEITSFHVFKKNQIGGVREILILPITNRIRINVLETLSRNICRYDKREILTHGSTKFENLKSILYESKKLQHKRIQIHITMDKSKWGPSFVPIQFLYLFTPFKKELGQMFYFITDLLIRHQNKVCLLPDRLVRAWYNDTDNVHEHKYKGLQKLKEDFVRTKNIVYKNESNMGQGILHYTSSLLHLSMIAFRDKLYQIVCDERGLNSNDHQDILSSDDSYTIFCPELFGESSGNHIQLKLSLFLKCQQLSEYLFNCRTSMNKSSINPLIGEFNSLFVSGMTFIPTLIKFSLSAVHPVNTDSFYRMVKESYSSSRQILENGGTLDIFYLSHILNKKYAESIYHTNEGAQNDYRVLGVNKIPYHLGYYPLFNPALMSIFGPEYHNYKLFKNWVDLNERERHLFSVSHKMVKGGLIETMAEFEEGDTILGGLLRIEAAMGPIRQHERLKRNSLLSKEQMELSLINDPIMMIRKPKTNDEIIFKVCQKLFTTGSAEAFKNLAASIYYGRVSATVSAKIFYIPNGGVEKQTYFDCLQSLIDKETLCENLNEQIKFIYPKYNDYDIFTNNDSMLVTYKDRSLLEIQTVQSLSTHRVFSKLTQPLENLLEYKWNSKPIPEHLESKVNRDFEIIKLHYPMIKDTLQETKEQFDLNEKEQTKSILLLILKLFSLRDRTFKGVIYGSGSMDINKTYEILVERNFSSSMTTALTSKYTDNMNREVDFDEIYQCYNHFILSEICGNTGPSPWEELSEKKINNFMLDPGPSKSVKKRILMIALTNGLSSHVEEWSGRIGCILHTWELRQKNRNNTYYGDMQVVLFSGSHKLVCHYNGKAGLYSLHKANLNDPLFLFEFIKELCEILSLNISDLFHKMIPGDWYLIDNRMIIRADGGGVKISEAGVFTHTSFSKCYVDINDKWSVLLDEEKKQIYRSETGLIPSDFVMSNKYDFKTFGLSFSNLTKLRCFASGFHILYKSRHEVLKLLDDPIVERPKISEKTQKDLKLDWEIKDDDRSGEVLTLLDETDLIGEFINAEVNVEDVMPSEEIDNFDNELLGKYIASMANTDMVQSMMTTSTIQQSRKLFERIKNLKYDMVSLLVLSELRINKSVLKSLSKSLSGELRKHVMFSVISVYDRTYVVEGHDPTENMTLDIMAEFLSKFGGLDDEMIVV